MSETKFTPGPWVISNAGSAYMEGISITTSDTHLEIAGVWDDEDAYLISAATDLYEALEMAMEIGEGCSRGFLEEFQKKAEAALLKARGKYEPR